MTISSRITKKKLLIESLEHLIEDIKSDSVNLVSSEFHIHQGSEVGMPEGQFLTFKQNGERYYRVDISLYDSERDEAGKHKGSGGVNDA